VRARLETKEYQMGMEVIDCLTLFLDHQ